MDEIEVTKLDEIRAEIAESKEEKKTLNTRLEKLEEFEGFEGVEIPTDKVEFFQKILHVVPYPS